MRVAAFRHPLLGGLVLLLDLCPPCPLEVAIFLRAAADIVRLGFTASTYKLKDGAEGDVYTVVLRAMASGEPRLTLKYPQIRSRVEQITEGEPPSGSSIVSTLTKMHEAAEKLYQDQVLEWDEDKETLNFPDPYFIYFLQWRSWA